MLRIINFLLTGAVAGGALWFCSTSPSRTPGPAAGATVPPHRVHGAVLPLPNRVWSGPIPQRALLLNDKAWLLATSRNEKLRDGKRAIALATEACEDTHWGSPAIVDTLAAAYAEAGQMGKAIQFQERALSLLTATDEYLRPDLSLRLEEYRLGKPHRQ